jgi:hypothetical protein
MALAFRASMDQRRSSFIARLQQWPMMGFWTTASPELSHRLGFTGRLFVLWKDNGRQSNPDRSLQSAHGADACFPSHVDGVLRLLLRVVRLCTFDAVDQARVRPVYRSGRQYQHRRGCRDDPGASHHWSDVRPLRSPQGLYGTAAPGCVARIRRGALGRLRKLPAMPPGHWRRGGELRYYAVPHVGDVRAERGRHG